MSNLYETQRVTETTLSKKRLFGMFLEEIQEIAPLVAAKQNLMKDLEENYLGGHHYDQKNERMKLFDTDKLSEWVDQILYAVADRQRMSISNLAGQIEAMIPCELAYHRLQTVGEIATYMAKHGLFTIYMPQDAEEGMLTVQSHLNMSAEFQNHAKECMYLPPMVVKPKKLKHNRDSGWLCTSFGSLITKRFNHHDGDISLDVINKRNSTAFSLNRVYLSKMQDHIPAKLQKAWDEHCNVEGLQLFMSDEQKEAEQNMASYQKFMDTTQVVHKHLIEEGNRFHLLHKKDKRGRVYSQGYHCSYQGNAHRKASIDFADKEVITGEL